MLLGSGLGVSAVALAALAGWALDLPPLKSGIPGLVAMNPMTAVGLLFGVLALAGLGAVDGPPARPVIARTGAAVILLIGLTRVADYLLGLEIGVDRLLFTERLEAEPFRPNRIAPNTALCFTLLGTAVLLLTAGRWGLRRAGGWLAVVAALIALFGVIGYGYGTAAFYGVSSFIPMALPTAIAFLLLCTGLAASRPRARLLEVLESDSDAAATLRRVLPAVVLIPIVFGWVQVRGQRAGLFDPALGAAIFTIASVALLVAVVWWDAGLLRSAERRRVEAEAARAAAAAEVSDLYEHAPCGYHSLDGEGRVVRINATELGWLGRARDEVVGHPWIEFLAPAAAEIFQRNFPRFVETGNVANQEYNLRRRDGTTMPVLLSATAIRDEQGRFLMTRSTMFDHTDPLRAREEIEALNRRLSASVADLEAVNRELETFSYSVSHDLRAPLRAIDGFSRILVEQHAGALTDEGVRLLGVVRSNTQRMGQLIDDLLAFSRFSRKELEPAPVDMAALARAALDEVRRDGPDPRAGLDVAIRDLPPARGDPALLRQVWVNLLSNALKYSRLRERPRVEVGAAAETGETVYHVRDNGIGFDMKYVGKLFGVFQRLHRPDEFEGTGVGLAIVQRIVHRHGGRVWADAELDRGATFFFSLPREA